MAAGSTTLSVDDVLSTESLQKCFENYLLVDVGASLTNKKFSKDLDSVIQRAKDAGTVARLWSLLQHSPQQISLN